MLVVDIVEVTADSVVVVVVEVAAGRLVVQPQKDQTQSWCWSEQERRRLLEVPAAAAVVDHRRAVVGVELLHRATAVAVAAVHRTLEERHRKAEESAVVAVGTEEDTLEEA